MTPRTTRPRAAPRPSIARGTGQPAASTNLRGTDPTPRHGNVTAQDHATTPRLRQPRHLRPSTATLRSSSVRKYPGGRPQAGGQSPLSLSTLSPTGPFAHE